jgi:tRNA modification GTPase
MTARAADTIAAVATAAGQAAIGVVRVSGPLVPQILARLTSPRVPPRVASYRAIQDLDGGVIDRGLVLFFPAPHSYTGEDVAELQLHGNPVLLAHVVQLVCTLGARPARPGEFSERAYRNGKLDLAQAEAVADLIASRSLRAARSAVRSLTGEFSERVDALIADLLVARVACEAALDFPDDTTPDLLGAALWTPLEGARAGVQALLRTARQGVRLHSGATIAIVGAPNVGKSTLLNALAGRACAIVSDRPGTTRDVIEIELELDGLPLRISDTAGLHASSDPIELEGMTRARAAVARADLVVVVTTDRELAGQESLSPPLEPPPPSTIVVHNKIDAYARAAERSDCADVPHVFISAKTGAGIDLFRACLRERLGADSDDEHETTARLRHVDALSRAAHELAPLDRPSVAQTPELAAEALRRAARELATIRGDDSSETLLGEIFARFCIGK